MNVLLALGTVPSIVVGLAVGLIVAAAVFGLAFLICILPDLKKGSKTKAAKPAEEVEEIRAENATEEETEEAIEEVAEEEQEEAVEVLEEIIEEETAEEAAEPVEEEVTEEKAVTEEEPAPAEEENVEEVSEVAEEPVKDEVKEEPAPVAEPVEEEVKREAVAVSAVEEDDEDEGEEDDVEDNETEEAKEARLAAIESAPELENNQRYNRSFKARLIQSSDTVKEWYALIKDAALSYKGVRCSLSWRQEKIYKGRTLVIKTALRGKTLSIYFPLSVSSVKNIEVEDVSDKAVHAATPALFRIKKDVHAQQALQLMALTAEKLGLEAGKAYKTDKSEYALQTTEQLVEAGLVKVVTVKK